MEPVVTKIESENLWLVDVPVRVRIWTRPALQKEQFECIRRARPSILILVSDGGRTEVERELISQSRTIFEGIDWKCEVHRFYWETNQGMYASGRITSEYIWSLFDRCVWLEDDIMFANGFLEFCTEMLKRYKDDTRILGICGFNHEGISEGPSADYFFSREASIWGTATWRRGYRRDTRLFDENMVYERECIARNARLYPDLKRKINGYMHDEYYEGHRAGGEFWRAVSIYADNQLWIVPKKNMISNKGCTADATHADEYELLPKGIQRVFNMPVHACEFPLHHPVFITPDERYAKVVYRILGIGHPFVCAYRTVVRGLKMLRKKGPAAVIRKMKKVGEN